MAAGFAPVVSALSWLPTIQGRHILTAWKSAPMTRSSLARKRTCLSPPKNAKGRAHAPTQSHSRLSETRAGTVSEVLCAVCFRIFAWLHDPQIGRLGPRGTTCRANCRLSTNRGMQNSNTAQLQEMRNDISVPTISNALCWEVAMSIDYRTYRVMRLLLVWSGLAGPGISTGRAIAADLTVIETVVVIYAENRSFDHLYGLFPGANGLANATEEQYTQRDHDGSVLPHLRVWNAKGEPNPDYPQMPNAPFRVDAPPVSKSANAVLISPIHAYYHSIEQINGGKTTCSLLCRP
jgi:hypothetical protein